MSQPEADPRSRALVASLKRLHQRQFMSNPNVVGMAYGRRIAHGERTDIPAMVVYVVNKTPRGFIPPSRMLPRKLFLGRESIDVDVVQTGFFYPISFTARERPAPSGISIGHFNITAGTLGCLVLDNTDGTTCILSNNHILADENAATIGDAILQPGPADGGSQPADTIGALKRFVTINATGNTVDAAIASIGNVADVVDQMKDNLMPVASPTHPAVGLLYAGSCNRTIMNPIDNVLNQLNIAFPAGAGSTVAADVGMNVEKVGRTTEYTTSTITEIDATVTIGYDFGSARFDNQIVTAWMSDGGDSGSLVCQGGDGGDADHCGCISFSAASEVLKLDLSREEAEAAHVRDRYLRQTTLGSYLISLFDANEERVIARVREVEIRKADRDFARRLVQKYAEEARSAVFDPQSKQKLEDRHFADAEKALGRAKKYMERDEVQAAQNLLKLARRARGKNFREALALFNDRKLDEEVRNTLSRVKFLQEREG